MLRCYFPELNGTPPNPLSLIFRKDGRLMYPISSPYDVPAPEFERVGFQTNRADLDPPRTPYPHGMEIVEQYRRSFRHQTGEDGSGDILCSLKLAMFDGILDDTLESSMARPVTDCPRCFDGNLESKESVRSGHAS